ncbi:MAG TPA: 2-amino-4-hydroxy-6-hydroxymethyldihydropteridine diphosphokinase [Pseudogracilibacillus sp.]|nr:2-amino-4-hydroxy-6-hydroxymethyldihydropteridine diphosphokinase [Pseudogracilibacillus sp.]
MNIAYISLGSNIEPRESYMEKAIALLQAHDQIDIIKRSSIYETAPVGYLDQSQFLNMVIQIKTSLKNMELLRACQAIENELGRERTIENGPRTMDLDILLYNNENRDLEELRIPHPRIHERAFVLIPLYEIAPDIALPTSGVLIEDILHKISEKEKATVIKWESNL